MLHRHRSLRRVLTTTAVALTALTFAACGSGEEAPAPGAGSSAASTGGAGAATADQGDVMFAQMMIPHHEQAVEMADLALEDSRKASAPVRELARQISDAQGPEIEQMRGWLTSWGADPDLPMDHDMGDMGMDGMMSDADLAALEAASGTDFDRRWLSMMIEHHEGAITMAEMVLGSTKNADVRTLAEAVAQGQQREIDTMKDLLG